MPQTLPGRSIRARVAAALALAALLAAKMASTAEKIHWGVVGSIRAGSSFESTSRDSRFRQPFHPKLERSMSSTAAYSGSLITYLTIDLFEAGSRFHARARRTNHYYVPPACLWNGRKNPEPRLNAQQGRPEKSAREKIRRRPQNSRGGHELQPAALLVTGNPAIHPDVEATSVDPYFATGVPTGRSPERSIKNNQIRLSKRLKRLSGASAMGPSWRMKVRPRTLPVH